MARERDTSDDCGSAITYHLAVDGGGSSCTAALISSAGTISTGESGPCNVSTLGVEIAISVLATAVKAAVAGHVNLASLQISEVPISSAWVALAGYDRPSLAPMVDAALSSLLNLAIGSRLTVSTDIDLLSVRAVKEPLAESAIVLVAGTGSIAMSYKRSGDRFLRTARVGGWGPLLGDEGSGFAIGKEALGTALKTSDLMRQKGNTTIPAVDLPAMSEAVFAHFRRTFEDFDPRDLLSTVLAPYTASPAQQGTTYFAAPVPPPTKRIAQVAQVVLSLAEDNIEARGILERGSSSLAELVLDLLEGQALDQRRTALILAGGLLKSQLYNSMVREQLKNKGVDFGWVMDVESPALEGARWLASKGL